LWQKKKRKIVVLGAPGVGKSAIIVRFKDDIFLDYYDPTIQTLHKKVLPFNNENIELEIVDLDGQTEYTIFSFSKFSFGIHGYILSYSIENKQSFELISIIHSKLISLVGRDIPKILVANKSDLLGKRVISYEEGKRLSESMGCPFIECSAKSSFNINRLFYTILVEINKYENNIDLSKLGCKKLFEFFIKNEKVLLLVYYISIITNLLSSIAFIYSGFYFGFSTSTLKDSEKIHIGLRLFFGFWNLLFSIVGIFGICKRKKDYINYFKISIFLSIILLIIMFIYNFFLTIETEYHNSFLMQSITLFEIFLQFIMMFFTFMFNKIVKDELSTYLVV